MSQLPRSKTTTATGDLLISPLGRSVELGSPGTMDANNVSACGSTVVHRLLEAISPGCGVSEPNTRSGPPGARFVVHRLADRHRRGAHRIDPVDSQHVPLAGLNRRRPVPHVHDSPQGRWCAVLVDDNWRDSHDPTR